MGRSKGLRRGCRLDGVNGGEKWVPRDWIGSHTVASAMAEFGDGCLCKGEWYKCYRMAASLPLYSHSFSFSFLTSTNMSRSCPPFFLISSSSLTPRNQTISQPRRFDPYTCSERRCRIAQPAEQTYDTLSCILVPFSQGLSSC